VNIRPSSSRDSPTGTIVPPKLTRQPLFGQAGVIATANLGELLDAAAFLVSG